MGNVRSAGAWWVRDGGSSVVTSRASGGFVCAKDIGRYMYGDPYAVSLSLPQLI